MCTCLDRATYHTSNMFSLLFHLLTDWFWFLLFSFSALTLHLRYRFETTRIS